MFSYQYSYQLLIFPLLFSSSVNCLILLLSCLVQLRVNCVLTSCILPSVRRSLKQCFEDVKMSPSFIQHFLQFELCLQPVVRFYYLGLLIQVSFNCCLHDALICFSRNALCGNFGQIFSCCNRTFFILWFCCLLYLQRAASPK